MTIAQKFIRLTLAASLLGSLSACIVAPPHAVGYRAPSVYVESYPTYRSGYPNTYYNNGYGQRHYDDRGGRYYRDERRYEEPRRMEAPFPNPAQVHRDVRRSLGLPRLPGMP